MRNEDIEAIRVELPLDDCEIYLKKTGGNIHMRFKGRQAAMVMVLEQAIGKVLGKCTTRLQFDILASRLVTSLKNDIEKLREKLPEDESVERQGVFR